MENQLSIQENTRLRHCEAVIEKSMNSFYEMGIALREIRDSKLYKESNGTFEDYLEEKWKIERRHGYRYIEAANTFENVSNWTQTVPTSEGQVRPLTKIKDPETQQRVWQEVVKESNETNQPITAKKVEQVVSRYCDPCVNVSIEFRVVSYLTPMYRKKLDILMRGEKESTYVRNIIEKHCDENAA
jgi:hypothetical protein